MLALANVIVTHSPVSVSATKIPSPFSSSSSSSSSSLHSTNCSYPHLKHLPAYLSNHDRQSSRQNAHGLYRGRDPEISHVGSRICRDSPFRSSRHGLRLFMAPLYLEFPRVNREKSRMHQANSRALGSRLLLQPSLFALSAAQPDRGHYG